MSRLVQRVLHHRTLEALHRRGRVAGVGVQRRQLEQQPEVGLPQRLAAGRGPVLVAVLRQQLARVCVEGRSVELRRALGPCRGRALLERVDVDPEAVVGEQHHVVAQGQPGGSLVAAAERPAGHVEDLVEAAARGIPAGPEALHHLLAVEAALGRQGQQLEQALGAPQAPGAVGHGLAVDAGGEAAQKLHAELRLFVCHCALRVRSRRPANKLALGPASYVLMTESHSVKRHLDVGADAYDAQIRRFIPHYEEMIATGVEVLGALVPADARVLDLGGGTGALSGALLNGLPEVRVTVLDVDPDMLGEARRRLARFGDRVAFHEASFFDPLPAADAVVASLALHHIHDLARKTELYRAIHDALPAGGVLLNLDAAIPDGPC